MYLLDFYKFDIYEELQKDIPYIVLKVKQDKNELYNVCECI